ncbi:MAG: hypothetical protein ACTSYA_02380 [Candidatus Kariarchaeaceae archaeon]
MTELNEKTNIDLKIGTMIGIFVGVIGFTATLVGFYYSSMMRFSTIELQLAHLITMTSSYNEKNEELQVRTGKLEISMARILEYLDL